MSSPGDDGERKTVMFLTPSPGSSQTSGPGAGSQDEKWSGNVAGDPEENWPGGQKGLAGQDQGVGRERWSPPAKLDPPPLPPPPAAAALSALLLCVFRFLTPDHHQSPALHLTKTPQKIFELVDAQSDYVKTADAK